MEKFRVRKFLLAIEALESKFNLAASMGMLADKVGCIRLCLDLFERVAYLSCVSGLNLDKYIHSVAEHSDLSVAAEVVDRLFFEFKDVLSDVKQRFNELV